MSLKRLFTSHSEALYLACAEIFLPIFWVKFQNVSPRWRVLEDEKRERQCQSEKCHYFTHLPLKHGDEILRELQLFSFLLFVKGSKQLVITTKKLYYIRVNSHMHTHNFSRHTHHQKVCFFHLLTQVELLHCIIFQQLYFPLLSCII